MPEISVHELAFDERNEDKLADHGVRIRDVLEMLDGPFRIYRNKGRGQRASHVMIGRDSQNRCIVVCIEPTAEPTTWRPVTGWFATSAHDLSRCTY